MSLESDLRRQMEQAAAQQASGLGDESVDAAFSFRTVKKAAKKSLGVKGAKSRVVVKKAGSGGTYNLMLRKRGPGQSRPTY